MKRNFTRPMGRLALLMLIGVVAFGTPSCKNKQKATKDKTEETPTKNDSETTNDQAARVKKAKDMLNRILNDESLSLADRKAMLDDVRAMKLNDMEINALIKKAEKKLTALDETSEENNWTENKGDTEVKSTLNEFCTEVAQAGSTSTANSKIDKMVSGLFQSEDVPVLIIISEENGKKDYDRPTTIRKYLDYLKDQKNYNSSIEQVFINDKNEITRLELRKKF